MDIHRSTYIKTGLDNQYSFLNEKNQEYVKYDNDIIIKYDIMKAVIFNEVISGTTAVFVDVVNIFGKRALNKTNFKIKTGARETHELCWRKDSVEVTKSTNVSVPEIIPLTKFQSYANNDLFINVASIIKLVKKEL